MSEYEDFDFDYIEHVTDDAVLLVRDDDHVWVPLSVVEETDRDNIVRGYYDEDIAAGSIEIATWWLIQKGHV